jgi:hypothetical protein
MILFISYAIGCLGASIPSRVENDIGLQVHLSVGLCAEIPLNSCEVAMVSEPVEVWLHS